jgi:hypothetical protein
MTAKSTPVGARGQARDQFRSGKLPWVQMMKCTAWNGGSVGNGSPPPVEVVDTVDSDSSERTWARLCYPVPMTPSAITALVDDALLGVRARCGPELHAAFDSLMERHGWLRGEDPEYYLGVNSQPVLVLPLWLADRFAPPPDILGAVLQASWLGYAAVRVQDDHMDEGLGDAVETMFLGQAYYAAHQRALVKVVGDASDYWERFEDIWAGYGAAMLLERRLLRPDAALGAPEYDAILKRSLPLLLPSAALLHRSGAWEDMDDLTALVMSAVRAAQLFNDGMDARDDLRGGRWTWVVRRFGGADGEAALMRTMVLGGGIDTVFAESSADLDAAAAAARRLGLPGGVAWIERRQEMMTAALRSALDALFARLLSSASPE